MPDRNWSHLLDVPAFPSERYAKLADRLAALMKTRNDVLLIQAEAVLALEAVATSLARTGLKALNIVTSPYGAWFGDWLKRGGSDVINLAAEPGRPIAIEAVRQQLDEHPDISVLSLVHAESATGILNPLEDIVRLARERGVLTVVDAVASIGGHALNVNADGIDIVVIGPQKALAGPTGVSAISVSDRAWAMLCPVRLRRSNSLRLKRHSSVWKPKASMRFKRGIVWRRKRRETRCARWVRSFGSTTIWLRHWLQPSSFQLTSTVAIFSGPRGLIGQILAQRSDRAQIDWSASTIPASVPARRRCVPTSKPSPMP
jgi:aspartate aminotransferase-like enzyme